MADTILLPHSVSAVTVYAIIRDADGAVLNGAVFESYVTANLGNYDIPMTEQGTASRVYAVAFPALSAGLYRVAAYQQAGGSPAETDSLIGTSYGEWDGSRFVRLGDPAGVSIAADLATAISQTTAASVRSAIGLASANLDTQLSTIDDFLDTEVAAIKAKTDNLPSDPADASDVSAAVSALSATLGTPSNLGSGATIAANLSDIEAQTDDIGAAGAGLTAVPWNASWDAEVQSEVQDALDGTIADSVPADGTRPSISQALYMLTQFMLERSVSSTTVTVKKPDGSTSLFTLTLNDATSPTSITRAS